MQSMVEKLVLTVTRTANQERQTEAYQIYV